MSYPVLVLLAEREPGVRRRRSGACREEEEAQTEEEEEDEEEEEEEKGRLVDGADMGREALKEETFVRQE